MPSCPHIASRCNLPERVDMFISMSFRNVVDPMSEGMGAYGRDTPPIGVASPMTVNLSGMCRREPVISGVQARDKMA